MSILSLNERDVEALIDTQLRNLGWTDDPKDRNRTVYRQSAKTSEQQNRLRGRADYILYASNSNKPLMVIETKKPGKDLERGLEQGKQYARDLECPLVIATNGVQLKTWHRAFGTPLYKNGDELDSLINEAEALSYQHDSKITTISRKVLKNRKELINLFTDVNDRLRRDGIRSGPDRFSEFANILFLKLISEIEEGKESTGTKPLIAKDYRWEIFRRKSGLDLLNHIRNTVIPYFQDIYDDSGIFTQLKIKRATTLEDIIHKLDTLSLVDIDSDIKGDAFEYFLQAYNKRNKDLSEYFTPRHLIKFMVRLINPKFGEKVYDPFCGTGGMLIEAFKHLRPNVPNDERLLNELRENTIYGREITTTARVAKMNMILIGDGHNNIEHMDSLENPVDAKYDVCITNIPLSQDSDFGGLYDVPKGGGDSFCFQHCIRSLKNSANARGCIIMPFQFLKAISDVKEIMYAKYKLEFSVVFALPVKVFLPYTSTRAVILHIKRIHDRPAGVTFVNIRDDGYTLDNKRAKREGVESDLEQVLSGKKDIQTNNASEGITIIRFEDLVANKYSLLDTDYLSFELQSSRYPTRYLKELIIETDERKQDTKCDVWSVTNKPSGFKLSRDMFAEQVYSKDTAGYKLVPPRHFAYSPARVNVGSININDQDVVGAVSPAYVVFKVIDENVLDPDYLYTLIKTTQIKDMIAKLCGGTVRQSLNFNDLLRIKIPLPDLHTQQAISKNFMNGVRKYKEAEKDMAQAAFTVPKQL